MAPSKEPCTFGGAIINTFFSMHHLLHGSSTPESTHAQNLGCPLYATCKSSICQSSLCTTPYHMASLDMPGQASSPVPPALDKHPAQKAWVVFPCPASVFHPHASHVLLFFGRWLFLAGSSGSVLALFDGTKGFGSFGSFASSNHM